VKNSRKSESGLLQNQGHKIWTGSDTFLGSFITPVGSLTLFTFLEGGGTKADNPELILSFAQIMIAFALFLATFSYAYYTRKLAEQQKKTYLLNKKIWEKKSTPRIWFSLARSDTTKVYLIASNLGGDVAQSVNAHIKTNIVEFPWKWPCILPEERVHIDLPDEISHINNLGSMEYLQVEYSYQDSNSNVHKETQNIEPKLMEEGINAPHRSSK